MPMLLKQETIQQSTKAHGNPLLLLLSASTLTRLVSHRQHEKEEEGRGKNKSG